MCGDMDNSPTTVADILQLWYHQRALRVRLGIFLIVVHLSGGHSYAMSLSEPTGEYDFLIAIIKLFHLGLLKKAGKCEILIVVCKVA